jgi:transposase
LESLLAASPPSRQARGPSRLGPTTIEVVLSEIGDIERFRSQKKVVAYAGLAPGHRESAGHKEGSGLLRWVLIQTACSRR